MVCESWKEKLDTYLDGELPEQEMRTFDAHVRGCPSCSADALARVQMKRTLHLAGQRFMPSPGFRTRMQQSIAPKPRRRFYSAWMFITAAAAVLIITALTATYVARQSEKEKNLAYRDHVFSEIADLHVETLASSSPVDVISTDRHTVKPWFQGKIPFAFNLPELNNSEFSLLGGRMTYLDQTSGAHLVYDVRKHHISVFVFPERSLRLPASSVDNPLSTKNAPFNMATWSQNGLRYFVIGDASPTDIDALAKLFKAAS